jgi:segregation and condensation protein A
MTVLASSEYQVQLDVFEGPLDLLLHLVRKHELNILDIPIAFVTEKYIEYLDLMKALNLDVAGEYLLMAATLAYIKSRELVPGDPNAVEDELSEEEGEDPRQELIRRLLEYQKYKDAAENLAKRPVVGRNVWTRGSTQSGVLSENVDREALAPLAPFPVEKLLLALDRALMQARIKLSHEVLVDRLSVSECIRQLADRLDSEGEFAFRSCFRFLREEVTFAEAKHEAVVTFLAILEMARLGLIAIVQRGVDELEAEDIFLARGTGNRPEVEEELDDPSLDGYR